jgi:hypothetical protein
VQGVVWLPRVGVDERRTATAGTGTGICFTTIVTANEVGVMALTFVYAARIAKGSCNRAGETGNTPLDGQGRHSDGLEIWPCVGKFDPFSFCRLREIIHKKLT